ncbi:MAG TPA: radical SAM protein [Desulfomonilia bacterium]|nr:radical SAM protein [Desulfomonilia bacterium]
MSEIALIYPYTYSHARNAMLFHPLGIAQLSAILRHEGMETSVLDLTFRSHEDALNELERTRPSIIGIYAMLTMVAGALDLASKLRKLHPDSLLVCGGPMPTLRPEQFTRSFDVIFRGESVFSFPRFCRDYLSLKILSGVLQHHARYPGIYARSPLTGDVIQTPAQATDQYDLDRLPVPYRQDYDHKSYQLFWKERGCFTQASIMTTYGCPHDCDFCAKPIFGNNYRRRNIDSIVDEVKDIRSLGYEGLWIADDCFTLDLDHVRAFCRRLIRENLRMMWSCLSRTDPIAQDDVKLMKQAGCSKVFFGLESGSDEVLKLMNKHTTTAAAEKMINLFSRCGIETSGFFIVGYPGETSKSIESTFAWSLKLPLNEISFTIPFPLPGTRLYKKVYGIKADADWNYENENRLIYRSEFDEGYLKRRIEETYEQFARKLKLRDMHTVPPCRDELA